MAFQQSDFYQLEETGRSRSTSAPACIQLTPFKKRLTIRDLPKEIVLLVFEVFHVRKDMVSATCFGLSSRAFYPILKSYFKRPISLGIVNCAVILRSDVGEANRHLPRLGHLLDGFMGPKYRGRTKQGWLYLNREVYGDEMGSKEWALERRESDYGHMIWYERDDSRPKHDDDAWIMVCLLPNPFNMGDSWYPEARKRIEAYDFQSWDVRARQWDLEEAVKSSHIWWWIGEEKFWEAWMDWTAMTGF